MMSYSDPWAVYGRVNAPPTVVVPAQGTTPADAKPMETPVAPKPKEGMGANLKFKLPAEAKLYVDGRLTMIGGTERSFTTPPLADGSQFYYDVKAEVIVDGKPVVEEKRVLVEAGATISESFPVLIAAVEGKSTRWPGSKRNSFRTWLAASRRRERDFRARRRLAANCVLGFARPSRVTYNTSTILHSTLGRGSRGRRPLPVHQ